MLVRVLLFHLSLLPVLQPFRLAGPAAPTTISSGPSLTPAVTLQRQSHHRDLQWILMNHVCAVHCRIPTYTHMHIHASYVLPSLPYNYHNKRPSLNPTAAWTLKSSLFLLFLSLVLPIRTSIFVPMVTTNMKFLADIQHSYSCYGW